MIYFPTAFYLLAVRFLPVLNRLVVLPLQRSPVAGSRIAVVGNLFRPSSKAAVERSAK